MGFGLCQKHFDKFKRKTTSVELYASQAEVFSPLDGECVKAQCRHDQAEADTQLCTSCHHNFRRNHKRNGTRLEQWLAEKERTAELPDPRDGSELTSKVATWFQLMPGTTGLELLHAIQVRDLELHLDPHDIRTLSSAIRASGP